MKTRTTFVCQECGYDTPKFLGKCPECGAWNTLKELKTQSLGRTQAGGYKFKIQDGVITPDGSAIQKLGEVAYKKKGRIQTNFQEMNTVLGGGLVLGSATLIAGDPGVGKSTLLLQLAIGLAGNNGGMKVMYISGEESAEQIKMRAERLAQSAKLKDQSPVQNSAKKTGWGEDILILATSDTDYAIEQLEEIRPGLVILDSVQTMQSENLEGLAGSVGQVRYTALQFIRAAKQLNIPTIIVGHVTKEGMVAGPMVLSHMVDTVLFLEGEKFSKTRLLRSLKNRFGPVDEVGIFSMEEKGLVDISNPEQLFLSASSVSSPGSVLVATLEGSRAFIVELQALVVYSKLAMPRRVVSGLDRARVELLLAVLQKHAKLPVDSMDVFVNVAGGMKLDDPGIDLGICLAVYSSLNNLALPGVVGIAEVGLLGELRAVTGLEKRIREAEKLGYRNIVTAKNRKNIREVLESFGKSK